MPLLLLALPLLQGSSCCLQCWLPRSATVAAGVWPPAVHRGGVKLHGGLGVAAVCMPGHCNSRQGNTLAMVYLNSVLRVWGVLHLVLTNLSGNVA
jgi:hypothetical protein